MSEQSNSMKAAVLYGNRDLRVVDVPKPVSGANGVLIKVDSVGVCGTDLHTYKLGMFKEMAIPQGDGLLFGHEFAGEVVEIGPDANVELAVGDRAVGIALGAYAEYCNVTPIMTPSPLVVKLPENVTYEEAATVEPLTVSLVAVKSANLQPGERVLVIGAGMIGQGCVQVIRALHPECEVIVTDVVDNRLQLAEQFGAQRTINAAKEDVVASMKALAGEEFVFYGDRTSGKIDVVIEASGLAVPLAQGLELVRPLTGRLVAVALYEDPPVVDVNQIVTKNIRVIGTLGYTREHIQESLDLIASGKVDRKALVSHRYALADAADAFEAQTQTAQTMKAVIKP